MRALLAAAVLAACGPAGRDPTGAPDADVDVIVDAPPFEDMSRVYAHSGETLYRLDTKTLASSPIGAMVGLPIDRGLLDLAVDKDDRIVGITREHLFSISATTGAAALIQDLSASAQGFTSLSFVPGASTSDPDILVSANEDGEVFQIDETTGTATLIGNYGTAAGGQIVSSGDLIGVRGLGIYATVDVGPSTSDYLAKIDPTMGWTAHPLPSPTGFDRIFGLGFWGGKVYGFVDDGWDAMTGRMIEIDPITGVGTLISSGNVRWFGAGVATDAPIIE